MRLGQRPEALAEGRQPGGIAGRQGEGQGHPGGLRPHRRQVREVHRQGLVAQGLRVHPGGEVYPLHQGIHGQRQQASRRRLHQGAVVAHPEHHILAIAAHRGEKALDEGKLGERHG
jgi:hypothetical protein